MRYLLNFFPDLAVKQNDKHKIAFVVVQRLEQFALIGDRMRS